jgi:Uma2 family endonuclease
MMGGGVGERPAREDAMAISGTAGRIVLGPADQGRPLAREAFAEAGFLTPWKYERAGGRLVVMAPDGRGHDDCSETLRDHPGAYRLAHPELVERVVSEAWIRVGDGVDRIADIGVYLVETRGVLERLDRVPDLVFEVVSPGRDSRLRDYVEKWREYQGLGVQEHVIIDRSRARLTIYRRTPDGYRKAYIRWDGAYRSPILPGFALRVREIF